MITWSDYPPGNHRAVCPACGTNPRRKDLGITVLDSDYAVAHCFKCGVVEINRNTRQITPAERRAFAQRMNALRHQHEAEKRERQQQTAADAVMRWQYAHQLPGHPYTERKRVRLYGLKVDAGNLLVPLRDAHCALLNLQTIDTDGQKRFMPGGRVKGLYHSIGNPSGRLVVCEGYATGATLHEQSGDAVAIAFNAGNLLPVAQALRAKFPRIAIVIAADDDWLTDGNPGLTSATAAARAVGGLLAVPDFTGLERGEKDTDFNDLARLTQASEVYA